ncbi:RNA 2',3'-cyclic phosphodiesterase [Candidatus Bathyarchaeota archaeon]|nr:MAG: RNA 2',3'-cyclic phosphodiesterase [Candidatus Bathyarchaeota archaeon]
MPEQIRSFIAFDIEDEIVLNNLTRVQDALLKTGADLKLVKPENVHVTLRFLGNITLTMVDLIHREMEKVTFEPFDIEIKGVGVFPNLRRINVIWAGIGRGADELRRIFNHLEPNLRRLGFQPDRKGFSPHLTIARVRTGRRRDELARCIQGLADFYFGVVRAEVLRLKRSTLTPKGPIYTTLREVRGRV